jgi:hypothetical protein
MSPGVAVGSEAPQLQGLFAPVYWLVHTQPQYAEMFKYKPKKSEEANGG